MKACLSLSDALQRLPHAELCALIRSGHRFSQRSEDYHGVLQSDEGFIVRRIVYEAAVINENDLYFQVAEQRLELLRVILEARGIGINEKVVDSVYTEDGHSPFFHVIMSRGQHPDFNGRMITIANKLIKMGADPLDQVNENGDTLLHIMAYSQNLECTERLFALDSITPDQKRALTKRMNGRMKAPIDILLNNITTHLTKNKMESMLKLFIRHGASMYDRILPGAETVEDRVQSIFPDIARRLIAFEAACKLEDGATSDKLRVRRI